jgi:glycosyltransferase involved in cell wall biosynthesis
MKIAFITRSTLYKVHGGDTIQILETAEGLRNLGIKVSIFLSHEKINYEDFDLLHFFNLTRPANILHHINKTDKPFVVTPILIDYSEYDEQYRKGFAGWLLRSFSSAEYIKTVSRWLLRKDSLPSKTYLWKGQRKSIQYILERAKMILPNSMSEYLALENLYQIKKAYTIIPNGINEKLFNNSEINFKDEWLVVCAARIEGIKNQLTLIKALNNTPFRLLLIGNASDNQKAYYEQCKKIAAANIVFTGRLSQNDLRNYYRRAKVHVLPSWFETCGLSSLEAAAMGCNIVVTDKGFTKDYFGNDAFYCNPGNPESIYNAVLLAAKSDIDENLSDRIFKEFTWKQAAGKTLNAYQVLLSPNKKFISVNES